MTGKAPSESVNGSTLEADGLPPKKPQTQETFVFWNRRGEFFHNLAPLNASLYEKHVSRGLACAGFDNDGDMDFAIADLSEGVRLFRNAMAAGHWLKVRLRSKNAAGAANGFGDGATAIAWVGGVPLRRSGTGSSYLSPSSRTLHWGLGPATRVDKLAIRWHAGATNVFENLEADIGYEITEGETQARRLAARSPGFSRADTAIPADADGSPGTLPAKAGTTSDEKQRLLKFWETQRAAMNAMKGKRTMPKPSACSAKPSNSIPPMKTRAIISAFASPVRAMRWACWWPSPNSSSATRRAIGPGSNGAWSRPFSRNPTPILPPRNDRSSAPSPAIRKRPARCWCSAKSRCSGAT